MAELGGGDGDLDDLPSQGGTAGHYERVEEEVLKVEWQKVNVSMVVQK